MLKVNKLYVSADNKKILNGINLELSKGKVIAIMGPNGCGKSTLANTIAGHPKYEVNSGEILIDDENINELSPDKRAKKGVFLSMQYPPGIEGVTVANFLRIALNSITGEKKNPIKMYSELVALMKEMNMDPEFLKRYLNVGFSGGEKKRLEMLQLVVLNPTYAILDETDSGLDVDALRIVADGINNFRADDKAVLLITHYNRILEYVVPDIVHIMTDGKIVKSGGAELAEEIEKNGYTQYVSN